MTLDTSKKLAAVANKQLFTSLLASPYLSRKILMSLFPLLTTPCSLASPSSSSLSPSLLFDSASALITVPTNFSRTFNCDEIADSDERSEEQERIED